MMNLRNRSLLIVLICLLAATGADGRRDKKKIAKPNKPAAGKVTPKPAKPAAPVSRGDDTTIKSTTLDVYQVYKPEIRQAPKPEFIPSLPPADTTPAPQQYDVPQQTLNYTYRSLPLRPLALGKDTTPLPYQNYIRLGGGNLSTIFGEAGIGGLHGRNWESAIFLHHISQEGDLAGQKFQQTGGDATATLHAGGHAWTAALDIDYLKSALYGYNHDTITRKPDDAFDIKYHLYSFTASVQNERPGIGGLDYHPVLTAFSYIDLLSFREEAIDLLVPVSKKWGKVTAGLGIHYIYNNQEDDESNHIFQIMPSVSYADGGFSGHLGLSPTFGTANTYLLPDITASFRLLHNSAVISAGWQAQLIQNTDRQLTTENPYAFTGGDQPQTRSDEVFLNIATHAGEHLSFSGRLSWREWKNLAEFVTGWPGDGTIFEVINDPKVEAVTLQLSARYQVAKTVSIGATGTWYDYYHKTFAHVWHEPGIRLKSDLRWQALRNLSLTGYLSVLDEIYAPAADGSSVKLHGVLDLGASAEYQIIPRLSAFLNTDNLLNRKNERWLGYPSFGINVYGGLRLKF